MNVIRSRSFLPACVLYRQNVYSRCSNVRILTFSARYLSSAQSDASIQEPIKGPQIVYVGNFMGRLKWLRRVSIFSSMFSMSAFPLLVHYSTSDIAMVGKVVIVGTAICTSLLSTVLLKLITEPYVGKLEEEHQSNSSSSISNSDSHSDRTFIATRLNLFGNPITTKFAISQIQTVKVSIHPFASFKAEENFYYVGKDIKDEHLKKVLTYDRE